MQCTRRARFSLFALIRAALLCSAFLKTVIGIAERRATCTVLCTACFCVSACSIKPVLKKVPRAESGGTKYVLPAATASCLQLRLHPLHFQRTRTRFAHRVAALSCSLYPTIALCSCATLWKGTERNGTEWNRNGFLPDLIRRASLTHLAFDSIRFFLFDSFDSFDSAFRSREQSPILGLRAAQLAISRYLYSYTSRVLLLLEHNCTALEMAHRRSHSHIVLCLCHRTPFDEH